MFAATSTVVLVAAVLVLSVRYEADPREDGGFAAMLTIGVIAFAVPIGLAIFVMSGTDRFQLAAMAVTVLAATLIATRRIGNLAAMWYPITALGAIILLALLDALLDAVFRINHSPGS